MKIYIPTYKRADSVKTNKWCKSAILVVRRSEEEEYRKYNPESEILVVEDSEDGSASRKRNAILKRTVGENIVMMDDDIKGVGFHEKGEMNVATEGEFLGVMENMFVMMEEMNTVLGGFNVQSDKKFYREYSPFSLSSVVLGPLTILRNIDEDIRYDDRLYLKEDYDIAIQVLKKYRKLLRFNKWYYVCEHIKGKGGCMDSRNMENELKNMEILVNKWGSRIVRSERKTQAGNVTINPIIKIPIKGI